MRSTAGWWLARHVWRLVLLLGGAALFVWALSNAKHGVTSWSVFGLGAAAGAGIALVALFWPWRSARLLPESRPTHDDFVGTQVFIVAVAFALVIVVGLIGHYGAAVGAFSVITGVFVLVSFRREARAAGLGRRRRPPDA